MSLSSKINVRQILAVFLVSIALFLGSAWGLGSDRALAEVLTREKAGTQTEVNVSDADYQSAKTKRREAQARRSAQATPYTKGEDLEDKLNLDESVPQSTKKFFNQIEGKEPIENETRP